MNRIFTITNTHDTAHLDGDGKGKVTFTVALTSTYTGNLLGMLVIKPLGNTQEEWLHLHGESERNFTSGVNQQVTVDVAVPGGTPGGKYSFRLDAISLHNPDEDYTEGPPVAIEVSPSSPPIKPFPWWILAVVAVVLAVGGVMAWLIFNPRQFDPSKYVGLDEEEAINSLKEQHYNVNKETLPIVLCDPASQVAVKPGQVAKVEKLADKEVKVVVAQVSAVKVPKVLGLKLREAQKELTDCSLEGKQTGEEANREYEEGQVIKQEPAANTQVESQTTINLVVAKKFDPKEVVGKPDAEATSILKSMGFTVRKTREQIILCAGGNTDSVKSGQVTKVEEAADKEVEIFVAQVSAVKVPKVLGLTLLEAQKKLTDCSLEGKQTGEEANREYEEGQVIKQEPAANTQVESQTTINLVVAKKFDPKEVVGKPDAEATSILKSMGFTVKKTREQIILCAGGNTDSVESGQVTKVEEAADKKVEIFVAQVSVKVPDVKGQKVEAAQKRLTDCSLKVEDSPTQKLILGVPVGEVIGQAPEAESEVDPETTINLEVSGIPPESLTGSWYSNYERQYNWRFVITQQNNSLRSQSVPPCPWFPNIESQGTITIEENELKLVWKVSNDTLIFRGTVTNAAQTGKATKILWNNGVVAQRSLFDPPDLVGEWKGSNNWTYTLSRQGNNAFVYSWTGTGPRDEQLEGELKIKDSNNVALKSSIKDNGRVTHSFEGCVSKVKGDRGQEIKFDNGGVLKRQP